MHRFIILWRNLRPKLLFARFLHDILTLGTGALIPYPDAVAATVQTQASNLTSVRGSHVGNDTAHHNVLDSLAVWTRHRSNLLSEEPAPFVHIGFIAALPTAIFQFPGHRS